MLKGISFALSACFIWGLIFIIPQFMKNFSALEIIFGRYFFYGSISLLILLRGYLKGTYQYPFSVWKKAFFLSFLSGYYLWVVLGIRYASPEICALVLGISPITIAFLGNWKQKEGNLRYLILPSLLILIGLIMINVPHIIINKSSWEFCVGLFCSFLSLFSWSAYVVLNSRFLKTHPHIISNEWATIQGVATLFWIFMSGSAYFFLSGKFDLNKYFNWNEETQIFLIGCAVLGLLCSWLGAFLWNKASIFLPVSLAGQLMIFETIFGIIFVYILEQQLPNSIECGGIVLLLGAVIYGIRTMCPKEVLT